MIRQMGTTALFALAATQSFAASASPADAAVTILPLSYPATTGVPMPMTGGVIARP